MALIPNILLLNNFYVVDVAAIDGVLVQYDDVLLLTLSCSGIRSLTLRKLKKDDLPPSNFDVLIFLLGTRIHMNL